MGEERENEEIPMMESRNSINHQKKGSLTPSPDQTSSNMSFGGERRKRDRERMVDNYEKNQ